MGEQPHPFHCLTDVRFGPDRPLDVDVTETHLVFVVSLPHRT